MRHLYPNPIGGCDLQVDYWIEDMHAKREPGIEIRSSGRALFQFLDKDNKGILKKSELVEQAADIDEVRRLLRQLPGLRAFLNPRNLDMLAKTMAAKPLTTVTEEELLDYLIKVMKADKFQTPRDNSHTEGVAKGVLRNGCIFQCDFHNGRMHGPGELYWPDGQSYVGQFKHNQISGEGLFTYPNGSTYEGGVEQGLRNGQGKFSDPSGASYVGDWENGERKGMGCQLYDVESGAQYVGEWLGDVRHGQGTPPLPHTKRPKPHTSPTLTHRTLGLGR